MYATAAENLGMLELEEENYEDAAAHFQRSISFGLEIGMLEVVASALEGLVAELVQQQRFEEAALLAGAADRARLANEVTPLQEYEHALAEQSRRTLEAELGRERFEGLAFSGSQLTLEDAVAHATASVAKAHEALTSPSVT